MVPEQPDIEAIVTLLQQQRPDATEVIRALQLCPAGTWQGKAYYQFIDSTDANAPGAAWQFRENIVLHPKRGGDIVLDVLQDGRVGGIEFTGRL